MSAAERLLPNLISAQCVAAGAAACNAETSGFGFEPRRHWLRSCSPIGKMDWRSIINCAHISQESEMKSVCRLWHHLICVLTSAEQIFTSQNSLFPWLAGCLSRSIVATPLSLSLSLASLNSDRFQRKRLLKQIRDRERQTRSAGWIRAEPRRELLPPLLRNKRRARDIENPSSSEGRPVSSANAAASAGNTTHTQ